MLKLLPFASTIILVLAAGQRIDAG